MANFSTTSFEEKDFALNRGAKRAGLGEHWSQADWENIEKASGSFDKIVNGLMTESCNGLFGITTDSASTSAVKVLGDMLFERILPKLLEAKLIETPEKEEKEEKKEKEKKEKKEKGKKEKPMSKADQIRLDNAFRIVEQDVDNAIKSINLSSFTRPGALSSQYLEIRLVGFLIMLRFLLKNKKTLKGDVSKMLFVNNIIVGAKRFVDAVTGLTGTSLLTTDVAFSQIALGHLIERADAVAVEYGFSGKQICEFTPELQIFTDYDSAIPKGQLSLYEHQTRLVQLLHSSLKNDTSALVTLRTTTGTGKTTIASGMAYLTHLFYKQSTKEDGSKPVFVFCCTLRQVIDQVANLAYNMGVPLAYAYIDEYDGCRIIRNWNCRDKSGVERQPALIVCDPKACIPVLADFPQASLFIDEPTIGLDVVNDFARANVELISNHLRKFTVLSSATLPEKCPEWILENHRSKFGDVEVVDIYSDRIHIGCEIYTLAGELVLAHSGCTNADQLNLVIAKLLKNPFVGRSYTANVVTRIHEVMTKHCIPNTPDINAFFKEVKNINANSIRGFALEMLSKLALCADSVITAVCAEKVSGRDLKELKEKPKSGNDDIVWEEEAKFAVGHAVDYSKLLTSHAHRFLGPTLIATTKPLAFVQENFSEFVEKFEEEHKKMLADYKRKLGAWESEIARMEARGTQSKLEKERDLDTLKEEKPKLKLGSFEINTEEHVRKFARLSKLSINASNLRVALGSAETESILTTEMNVPESLRVLLACGVAVIGAVPSPVYNRIASRLFTEGKLAFAISDVGIAYGTNVPLNRIIATKDFTDAYSINTVYQLIARAGRVGKSWIAEAFIDAECATKIVKSIQTTSVSFDVETANLNKLHEEFSIKLDEIDAEMILVIQRQLAELEATKKAEAEAAKAKAEAEAKAKAEAEAVAKAEEEALLKLAQRKAQRTAPQRMPVSMSSVMKAEPVQSSTASIGQKQSNTNGFNRRAAPASAAGAKPRRTVLDGLANL